MSQDRHDSARRLKHLVLLVVVALPVLLFNATYHTRAVAQPGENGSSDGQWLKEIEEIFVPSEH